MNRHQEPPRGFTLIEMLVVISILTLLIGILTPSLKRAREQSKDTLCRSNLHSVYLATLTYLHDYKYFPELNNDFDDGSWQYNYLIYDKRDFDQNFGPLVNDGRDLDTVEALFCPRQTDPYHSFDTAENPWPVRPLYADLSAGYGRKNHLTGRSIDQFRGNPAIMADVFHLPKVVRSAHKTGINAVYLGGDVHWVPDTGFLTKNELTKPFKPEDNDLIEDIWDKINRGGQ